MANMQVGNLHAADIVVIVLYLSVSIFLGLYYIFKNKASLRGLFLASRSMSWWPIGLSMFASNIGSVHYVGIAGNAAASGLAVILFEWNAVFQLVLLGWIFLPVYMASGIYTMPEYISMRFGGKRLRIFLSVVGLLTYVFTYISSDLYSGALFMRQSLNINLYAAVAIILLIALIFTGLGGLKTVIITDSLAVFVMVIGGLVMCVLGLVRVGGWQALKYKYSRAVPNTTLYSNTTCGYPREDAWHIYRHPWTADYPSVALVLRTTIGTIWYWCANQVLVQRALAAKNITHAKAGCVFAGYLKFMPMIIMVIPGMISRVLYPDEVGCADPASCMEVCGSEVGCSNIALPKLVIELLPIGVRGLMVASVIAAVISSLTSIFNSASAIFTIDIWQNVRPKASHKELMIIGRTFVVVLVAVSIMWIPVMSRAEGGEIFRYTTTITGNLTAPMCAMFVLAMFWRGVTEEGAFWGMIVGQLWGLVRFVLDMVYPPPICGEPDERPLFLSNFHAHYHTTSQIILSFLLGVFISLATKSKVPSKEQLAGLTYWTKFEKSTRDKDMEERRRQRFLGDDVKEDNSEPEHVEEVVNGTSAPTAACVSGNNNLELREMKSPNQLPKTDHADCEDSKGHSFQTRCTSVKQRFVQSLCGAPDQRKEDCFELIEDHSSRVASIKQTTFWRYMMNANAAILLVVAIILNGVFF